MFHSPALHSAARRTPCPVMPKTSEEFWPVFRDLVEAREVFNLARPVLTTLRALISFMERGCIVYASNRKICERAEGISQSSLRRHITALISAGLARRVSSPNGKRYALRTEGLEDLVFGIDLTPLMAMADEIATAARLQRDTQARVRHLRKAIGGLLYQCSLNGMSEETLLPYRRDLRRKLSAEGFELIRADLEAQLAVACRANADAFETTASDSQHDCQINITNEKIRLDRESLERPSFDLIAKAEELAPDALELLKDAMSDDLNQSGRLLGTWVGISPSLVNRAISTSGAPLTIMSMLLIIQNLQRVRSPSAYFSAMTLGIRRDAFMRSVLHSRVTH